MLASTAAKKRKGQLEPQPVGIQVQLYDIEKLTHRIASLQGARTPTQHPAVHDPRPSVDHDKACKS